jgi:hypothetical protein
MRYLRVTFMIPNMGGRRISGTFKIVLLLLRIMNPTPKIISKIAKKFIEIYLHFFVFSGVPRQIQRISLASCAQLTDI